MAGSTGNTNYKETYFLHKEVTKIHGEPTYETIHRLHKEIKANAASVPSNLGGGALGHLGLAITDGQYALLSNAAFNRPVHPGQLVIPPNSTQAQIAALKEQHEEQLRVFKEVLAVESALRQQINGAIDPTYLNAIRNRQTNAIVMTVSDIFHRHLYDIYGKVDKELLETEREKVVKMTYDVSYPPDVVYEAIEDLLDLATAADNPFSQRQAVSMAFKIINRTGRFEHDVRSWMQKTTAQKTWINFKQHFNKAYKEMKQVKPLLLADTAEFNQAANIKRIAEAIVLMK